MERKDFVHSFNEDISHISLPVNFTFPFYYTPHELCKLAANKVQNYLEFQSTLNHNFGLDLKLPGLAIGKMFGVLVVETQSSELGYLCAFSGELQDKKNLKYFVPPINNSADEKEFQNECRDKVESINTQINKIESDRIFIDLKTNFTNIKEKNIQDLFQFKEKMRDAKKERKLKREKLKLNTSSSNYQDLEKQLIKESLHFKHQYIVLKQNLLEQEQEIETNYSKYHKNLIALKDNRKTLLNQLQMRTLDQYKFLNILGETKSLINIFKEEVVYKPNSGTGDCAAPKLLQYAFKNNLKPIAMAEFWWGAPHKSAIRKHKQFYPACSNRCKPLLKHMLKGLNVDPNPMLKSSIHLENLEVIYEDNQILVINKPSGLLSVPGKHITDSVATRLKNQYPSATGPLIVHRLDQDTSGVMLIAKSKQAHKELQKQFINRTIKKRYIAILDGIIPSSEGTIELPLRGDPENRPYQLICHEYGKEAKTDYKVLKSDGKTTEIHFFPLTGRTHQLRMHAAHISGLNAPIIGDDLYGRKSNRLHLHAEWIQFIHPHTKTVQSYLCKSDFSKKM